MKRIRMIETCYNFGTSNIPWEATTRFHKGDAYLMDEESANFYLDKNWALEDKSLDLPEVK